MRTKVCTKCNKTKKLDCFTEKSSWCKECKKEYDKHRREDMQYVYVSEKKCVMCNEIKPTSLFHKSKACKDGFNSYCIECSHKKYLEIRKEPVDKFFKDGKCLCSKCNELKDISEFHKNKTKKRGVGTICKDCSKKYYIKYRINNKEKLKKSRKESKLRRKDAIKRYNKEYVEKNKEKVSEQRKKYYEKNKEIILSKCYEYVNNKKIINPLFRFQLNIRNLIKNSFKKKKFTKKSKTYSILGCDCDFLISYFEGQFAGKMSWENYGKGGWVVDHIIPLATAKTEEDVIKLNHYTNLRPMWDIDNAKKGKKIIEGIQFKMI